MRLYALLLGTLLTAASAYVAQMAVTSSRFDRAWQVLHPDADPPSSDPVWYGGVLHPPFIQGRRPPVRGILASELPLPSAGRGPLAQDKQRSYSRTRAGRPA